jgi:hypothetical protein
MAWATESYIIRLTDLRFAGITLPIFGLNRGSVLIFTTFSGSTLVLTTTPTPAAFSFITTSGSGIMLITVSDPSL